MIDVLVVFVWLLGGVLGTGGILFSFFYVERWGPGAVLIGFLGMALGMAVAVLATDIVSLTVRP